MPINKYSLSVIYEISCLDKNIKDTYIGSTISIQSRITYYKRCKTLNTKMFSFIIENGGWNNWDFNLLERCDVSTKKELLEREGYYINKLNPSLNMCKAHGFTCDQLLLKGKITCTCGLILLQSSLYYHIKTKTHLEKLKKLKKKEIKKNNIKINKEMSNQKYFKTLIIENRPNLASGTIKTYLSIINTMAKLANIYLENEEDILKHINELCKTFQDKSPLIKKSKLATLIVVLDNKKNKHSKELDIVLDKLRKEMFHLADKNKEENVQQLTPTQQENIISWSEVLDVYKDLERKAKPLMNGNKLNIREFEQVQKYILLSLYVLAQPRRSLDYTDFKIKNINENEDNFLKIKNKKGFMVFNKYKNASRLGAQEIPIDNKLKLLIQKWTSISPNDYLISANNGNHITSSRISTMLNDIFGKNISSSLLRHIYMSHEFGNVDLEKLRTTTENMGSKSIDTMLNYAEKK